MTCIKKRLRIAYENIAFYGNKTWINDCLHYTRMNQELYARECRIQESEWTELVVRRPRTVQDVIPNSKLAQYMNSCEYNASRELSYRPTLSFDITFHYPCLYRNSSYNEPWMLPEVEELFMMHTCVDTLNFMCYKKLEDLPNLDFIDARHSEGFCCQLEIEEDFHEISPLLEDMFDRTPGQPSIPGMTNENERTEVMIPPLYKVTTLDEMLMKMKLRFGNIRQIWSVSKGGTCPDRAMKVFKSPFKSSFVREKHQFDILGIEMFTLFPHGKDARRLRNLREIRSIQKLAEAIKDFQKSLKQIKHLQPSTNLNHINSQDTSAPSLASEEAATSSAPTARRLYSDVVQGLSSIKTPPSIKSDYYSTECTTTPTNSSARESYISISSCSSSPQSTNNNVVFPQHNTRSQTPPMNWIVPETVSVPFLEELQSGSQQMPPSQRSIAGSSYRTQPSSTSAGSDVSSVSNNNYSVSVPSGNNRIADTPFQNVPPCAFSNVRAVNNQPQTPLQPQQQMPSNFSTTCFYSNSYAPCSPSPNINNPTVGFCPATGSFYQQNAVATYNNYNYGNLPQPICTFRNTLQAPPLPIQQPNNQSQTAAHVATRTYSSQHQNQTPTSSTWIVTPHPQFTNPQTTNRNNTIYSITNYASPYVLVPSGTLIKANNATATPRWPPGNPQMQNQQQYSRLPMSIAPPPAPPQNMQQPQVYHQNSPPALWTHVNPPQGAVYRTTPSPQQITIEESRRKPQQCSSKNISSMDSSTTILTKASCTNAKTPTNPTAILIKPNIVDQQQRKVSKQEENNKYFKSGVIITSRSEDLERQALEEYHPSNETFLTEIERQAEEQYDDSSSENWLSPLRRDFLIEILSRGASVMPILIA